MCTAEDAGTKTIPRHAQINGHAGVSARLADYLSRLFIPTCTREAKTACEARLSGWYLAR